MGWDGSDGRERGRLKTKYLKPLVERYRVLREEGEERSEIGGTFLFANEDCVLKLPVF